MSDEIQQRFEAFHVKHPEVYDELVTMAYLAKDRGRSVIGMKHLFEVCRWNRMIRGLPDEAEEFKLSNSYTSRYARKIMENEPPLVGMFVLRPLATEALGDNDE